MSAPHPETVRPPPRVLPIEYSEPDAPIAAVDSLPGPVKDWRA
jgi:hypothetical protein